MKVDLELIKDMVSEHDSIYTANTFIDERIDGMKNPEGYVASYYSFFVNLMKELKPDTLIELGSWRGTSACCFAYGSPDTTVITVDHHTDPGDDINKSQVLKAEAQFDNLTYCQGWTCDQLYEEQKDLHQLEKGQNAFPKVVKALGGKTIDVLFIDSWHEYTQAKKDWEAYKPLLSDEALIICDDILQGNVGGGIDNMVKFWDEMEGEKFLTGKLHSGFPMGFVKFVRDDV